jgi:ribosomal protein L37E
MRPIEVGANGATRHFRADIDRGRRPRPGDLVGLDPKGASMTIPPNAWKQRYEAMVLYNPLPWPEGLRSRDLWGNPSKTNYAMVQFARDLMEMIDRTIEKRKNKMSHRRCWQCGHVAYYTLPMLPYCACEKCGSADTRVIRKKEKP